MSARLQHQLAHAVALILCWLIVWHDRRTRLADFTAYEAPRRWRIAHRALLNLSA